MLPKHYLANLMATNWQMMCFITSRIFLFLETEPRALYMLDTLPLNHMPNPLSISLSCGITALMNPSRRPGGDWSSCVARQLKPMAGWVLNFVHMFMYAWAVSKLGGNLLTNNRNSE